MKNGLVKSSKLLKNFFIPHKLEKTGETDFSEKKVTVIVPTYNPSDVTYFLVTTFLKFNPTANVVLVDDSTPEQLKDHSVFTKFEELKKWTPRFHTTTTVENRFKAGASNRGLQYVEENKIETDVIIICDDDVYIKEKTIRRLVATLYKYRNVAATCSLFIVKNKNQNLVTRLQALEYHGFNISKIADNSFIAGPLVIHGMLGAFRYDAIEQVGRYTTGHLIEDYDLTVRLKRAGYQVLVTNDDSASTIVPTTFKALWKQRVRWSYGGIKVIRDYYSSPLALFQDLFGHFTYIFLLLLIILSFILARSQKDAVIPEFLLDLSVFQFLVAYLFGIVSLKSYKQADFWDYLIRILVIPELLYSTLFSFILLGSYSFYLYNSLFRRILPLFPNLKFFYNLGLKSFKLVGFSSSWGTK
jgi:poly-beta-1,6-N-acetyl-D-glucosamine synthase